MKYSDNEELLEKLRAGESIPIGEFGELRMVRQIRVVRDPYDVYTQEMVYFKPADKVRELYKKFDLHRE